VTAQSVRGVECFGKFGEFIRYTLSLVGNCVKTLGAWSDGHSTTRFTFQLFTFLTAARLDRAPRIHHGQIHYREGLFGGCSCIGGSPSSRPEPC